MKHVHRGRCKIGRPCWQGVKAGAPQGANAPVVPQATEQAGERTIVRLRKARAKLKPEREQPSLFCHKCRKWVDSRERIEVLGGMALWTCSTCKPQHDATEATNV